LKLQSPAAGEVSRAGYLADLGELVLSIFLFLYDVEYPSVPYAPSSTNGNNSTKQPKVIGPASTLKLVAKASGISSLPESDPGAIPKGQHWVDLIDEGTVVVIEQPEGQSCAAIGGIMALRMKTRGAKGCVVGGRVRDLEELNSSRLPVSARLTFLMVEHAWAHDSVKFLRPVEEQPQQFTRIPRAVLSFSSSFSPRFSRCMVSFPTASCHHSSPLKSAVRHHHTLVCIKQFLVLSRRQFEKIELSCTFVDDGVRRVDYFSSSYSSTILSILLLSSNGHRADRFLGNHQVWASGKSTVGTGAESIVFGRNIDISVGGIKVSPVRNIKILGCICFDSATGGYHLL
jgi:methionine-rich copper-binding protein CopC